MVFSVAWYFIAKDKLSIVMVLRCSVDLIDKSSVNTVNRRGFEVKIAEINTSRGIYY
jgi:hypothetical protein